MRALLAAIRDDLKALARMHGHGSVVDYKALCLDLVDRAAACAAERHGEVPDDVLGHLLRAMVASGRGDVAAVLEEIERALVVLENSRPKPAGSQREAPPPPSQKGRAPAGSAGRVGEATAVAEMIDPLLVRLRAKQPK